MHWCGLWRLLKVNKYLQLILLGVVLLGIVALVANPELLARKVSARAVTSASDDDKLHSSDMKELRTRFNKDRGKVRLLMLLSPT